MYSRSSGHIPKLTTRALAEFFEISRKHSLLLIKLATRNFQSVFIMTRAPIDQILFAYLDFPLLIHKLVEIEAAECVYHSRI